MINCLAFAITFGADYAALHCTEHGLLHTGDISGAMASGAGVESSAVFGASAFALSACHPTGNLEFLIHPVCYVFQIYLYLYAQVCTFVYMFALGASAEASEVAVRSGTFKCIAENISEMREYVLHRESA